MCDADEVPFCGDLFESSEGQRWRTFITGNRRPSTPTGSTTGSIPHRQCPRLLELVRARHAGPYEARPVSTRVNSVQNDDPDILVPMPWRGLF